MNYQVLVIGGSAGAMEVYRTLFAALPPGFPLPVIVVQHFHPNQGDFHLTDLGRHSPLAVREASTGQPVAPGVIHFAPPNYHLLIEADRTFSLTVDDKVNFCRPSIDVTFECAAQVYGHQAIGLLLSGANQDGARGLFRLHQRGGYTMVQEPASAASTVMPQAALDLFPPDEILRPAAIAPRLITLIAPRPHARETLP